jgi:hypothetical protein
MSDALQHAIELLTDGQAIDWESLLQRAVDDRERAMLRELRALQRLGDPVDVESQDGTPFRSLDVEERWGHLELRDEIGRGATGVVYRAWDARLAREVALKLVVDGSSSGSLEEARRLARVTHPNVVDVYGVDRIDGHVGLWMEVVSGRTLDDILQTQGPFSAREATGIAVDLCGAVSAIHAAGLAHRDLKAQNVMREHGGRLVVMDMGTSVDVTRDDAGVQSLAGTPLYMAPELFDGAAPSVATDIYAIGVLLYRLVTSTFPIDARTIGDVRRAHANAGLRPLREVRPNLPPEFVRVVERCMAPEPTARFTSVAALEHALQAIGNTADAPRITRGLIAPGVTLVVIGALAGLLAVWAYGRRDDRSGAATGATVISAEQYKIFSAYEEIAFDRRLDDPRAAAAATHEAMFQVRSSLTGLQPVSALLYARLSECWRRAGDLRQAAASALDASVHAVSSAGDDHPYSAIVAMETARNLQQSGNHHQVAVEIGRALNIRWRALRPNGLVQPRRPLLAASALEQASRDGLSLDDTDGDGLLDLIEAAAGLDPRSTDSNHDRVLDDDEDHDGDGVINRLALGLLAMPFQTWAHFGARNPRSLAWQAPARFPMVERPRPDVHGPAWSISTSHSMGYFTQRLSDAHSRRAIEHGFSLLVRVHPEAAESSLVVDTSPRGPRFDVTLRRVDDQSIAIQLLTVNTPRQGPVVVVTAPTGGAAPLIELRYRPQWPGAALYADGHRLMDGYAGHRQYQEPSEGGVAWGVVSTTATEPSAAAAFSMVWLEVF